MLFFTARTTLAALPPKSERFATMAKTKKAEFKVIEFDAPPTENNAPPEAVPGNGDKPIPKPGEFSLDKFKSKRAAAMANVETLQTALPHHSIAASERLRPAASRRGDVLVAGTVLRQRPDQGPEARHAAPDRRRPGDALLAEREDLALPLGARDQAARRLFPLSRPDPEPRTTPGTPQTWRPARKRRRTWVQATSRKEEGVEGYKIDFARDRGCFPRAERGRRNRSTN